MLFAIPATIIKAPTSNGIIGAPVGSRGIVSAFLVGSVEFIVLVVTLTVSPLFPLIGLTLISVGILILTFVVIVDYPY